MLIFINNLICILSNSRVPVQRSQPSVSYVTCQAAAKPFQLWHTVEGTTNTKHHGQFCQHKETMVENVLEILNVNFMREHLHCLLHSHKI